MAAHINRNLALQKKTDFDRWSDAESLELAWDQRAEVAAGFVPAGSRVLDIGCGRMALSRFLPGSCIYQPCDLVARDSKTIVCDLNAGQFPSAAAAEADVIVMLGLLEYVADLDALFTHLRYSKCDLVVSYCVSDLSTDLDYTSLGWVNQLSLMDLAVLFDQFGFRVQRSDRIDELQFLMRLTPADRTIVSPACDVAVISGNDAGNFGDRLGYHIVNSLLPATANVHHLTFSNLEAAREAYDLVILGIGNNIFQPLLTEEIFDVLNRGKASIGIFGTQYRELIPRHSMNALVDRLDTWFARYEEDVLMYGRGRSNVVHLGDWLIDQFPMTRGTEESLLNIDDNVLQDLPLDRTIQAIQHHKHVFSTRLHPLLCALTAAELVAYSEQPSADMPGIVSGKFRSMLIDVFGRTFPERSFFLVDRDAVALYKARVHENVGKAAAQIGAMLSNVAAAA
jgi:hypothetical protein